MPKTRQAPRAPPHQPPSSMYPPIQNGAQSQYISMPPPTNLQHHQMQQQQQQQHQQQQPQQYYDGIYPGYGRSTPPSNWPNGNGIPQQHMEGYQNAMAGPSRPQTEYQSFPTHRTSPSGLHQNNSPLPPDPRRPLPPSAPPGPGWSSVHPGAVTSHQPSAPQSRTHGVSVKLEDLVSDAPRSVANGLPYSVIPGALTSIPLSVAQQEAVAAAAQGVTGEASSQGPSEFIKKLYKMLEEESVLYGNVKGGKRGDTAKHGAVGWGKGGTSFVVWEMNDFTTKILPQTFRHSNFSSFVRQLNKYGFSKIKHVDEDTGQIKENVWEFQHPNFQAGGKADLDIIKRKAPVPKKAGEDRETSPSRGLSAEETGRIMEMESRLLSLEDRLYKTEEALSAARNREIGLMGLMREVISQLGNMDKEANSPSSDGPTPRILRIYQSFDQVAQNIPSGSGPRFAPTAVQSNHAFNPAPFSTNMLRFASDNPSEAAHISPRTDTSSRPRSSGEASPAGSQNRGPSRLAGSALPDQAEDIIELGQPLGNKQIPTQSFNPDQFGMFTDPSWFTGDPAYMPINPRKSSDGTTLRLMAEAFASRNAMNDDSQDPLDTTPRPGTASSLDPGLDTIPSQPNLNMPTITQSPFGTLIIPAQNEGTQGNGIRLRRSTIIKPSWTQSPKILVVEDDVVYRQLSRKFLEKFGCQIEVVENAQVAIERMNETKYDLVLMDIFFGPHMDGRKATSLIRQFDMYTPIISMTSNAQPQDVDSYLQSGMTDVLAKPFTKHGLFGILDKHLIHLKNIQLSGEVPRFIGVPPLSDQGIVDAVANGAAQWGMGMGMEDWRNPLVGMGWSDETYQLVLQQFMQTGSIADVNTITNTAIGTNVVFGDSAGYNRKRSIESPGDDWLEEERDLKKARNEGGVVELS